MTLTARREPTFHGAGRDSHHDDHGTGAAPHGAAAHAPAHGGGHGAKPHGVLRFVSTVQIVGSLLAVPLGLASGYSIYRANFAPETTCQQLRGSIISMLDKNVDAATRRMLVRRDIEAFEQNCGGVDPDAHAAFKRLLAVETPVAVPLPKADPKPGMRVVKIEATPKAKPVLEVERVEAKVEAKVENKVETKPERKIEAKTELKTEPQAEPKSVAKAEPQAEPKAEPVQGEATLSDTRWVAAVRQALVKHPVPVEPEGPVLHRSWTLSTPATAQPVALEPVSAPQMPPALTITPATPPKLDAADHPVPPGSIPDARAGLVTQAPISEPANDRSRLQEIISDIPVVGRMVRRGE